MCSTPPQGRRGKGSADEISLWDILLMMIDDNHDNDDVDGDGGWDWEEKAAGADVISLWDRDTAHKKCRRKNWKETQKPLWAWHVGAP